LCECRWGESDRDADDGRVTHGGNIWGSRKCLRFKVYKSVAGARSSDAFLSVRKECIR
jgi:hypothetical protein